ncbi:MAG TPA: alcohol dehydrogenase catalytic domain-containing protein [Kineosporiaceae bacterium]
MRALLVERFGASPRPAEVPDPACPPHGVVVRVEATGLCRSDWHAVMGHDPDVVLPYVPGHEFAGVVVEVGAQVSGWAVGARVTAQRSPDAVALAVRRAVARAGGPTGVHVALDALGSEATCHASIAGLLPAGRHVQVGLLPSAWGPRGCRCTWSWRASWHSWAATGCRHTPTLRCSAWSRPGG